MGSFALNRWKKKPGSEDAAVAPRPGRRRAKQGRTPRTVAGSMEVGRGSAADRTGVWLRRIAGGLVAVFILAGAAAGIIGATKPSTAAGPDTSAVNAAQVHREQAGGYATGFVGTWLSATQENPDQLRAYLGAAERSDVQVKNKQPIAYRDLATVSTEQLDTDRVLVTVAAAIANPQPAQASPTPSPAPSTKKGAPTPTATATVASTWIPHYYQVTVTRTGENMSVAALPTPVAAPAVGTPEQGAYRTDVPDSGIRKTVGEMLSAYAAGKGDLSRYTAAGVNLAPITPTPYQSVSLRSLKATSSNAESPADGTTVRLVASVDLTGSGFTQPATYYLTLVSESGKWEISDLSATPATSPAQ